MSRTLKLIFYGALVEMALVALGVFAWRQGLLSGLPAPGPITRQHAVVLYAPVSLIVVALYAGRRLTSERLRISDSHRRYIEITMRVIVAVMVALQGLYAYAEVSGAVVDRMLMARGVAAFTGLLLAIQGNVAPKLDPPGGEGAPGPAIWTRTLLRAGWIMVLLGVGLVVCALMLPGSQLFTAMIAVLVAGFAVEIYYRRVTRPGRHA